MSWDLADGPGGKLNLNVKVKYTPRGKMTVKTFDSGRTQATPPEPKPSLADRVKQVNGLAPEKITVDAGLVLCARTGAPQATSEVAVDQAVLAWRSTIAAPLLLFFCRVGMRISHRARIAWVSSVTARLKS